MGTKTDYYNRIISSLQSEITALQATVSELQKEMEEMRKASREASERNPTVKQIPVESNPPTLSLKTLPRKEVEILISKMKAVCDEAIRANHENYIERFATREELDPLQHSFDSTFLPIATFRDYQKEQEIKLKSIEERLGSRFSLLTINRYTSEVHPRRKAPFRLERISRLLTDEEYQWIISIFVSLLIGMMSLYLFQSIDL